MASVFLSYSHKDKATADSIAGLLTELEVEYFLDSQDMVAGDHIPERIAEGLTERDTLIAILSPASLASPWVAFELGLAWGSGRRFIPYLTDTTLNLPGFLHTSNHVASLDELKRCLHNPQVPIGPRATDAQIALQRSVLDGFWKGRILQRMFQDDKDREHSISVQISTGRSGTMGDAHLNYHDASDRPDLALKVDMKLIEGLVHLHYRITDRGFRQFGYALLKVSDDKSWLNGKFIGLGIETKDVVTGTLELQKRNS